MKELKPRTQYVRLQSKIRDLKKQITALERDMETLCAKFPEEIKAHENRMQIQRVTSGFLHEFDIFLPQEISFLFINAGVCTVPEIIAFLDEGKPVIPQLTNRQMGRVKKELKDCVQSLKCRKYGDRVTKGELPLLEGMYVSFPKELVLHRQDANILGYGYGYVSLIKDDGFITVESKHPDEIIVIKRENIIEASAMPIRKTMFPLVDIDIHELLELIDNNDPQNA